MVQSVARAPDRLEIGHRPAGSEMPLGLRGIIAQHAGQGGDGFGLDHTADAAGVARTIVGIVQHGREPAQQTGQGQIGLHVGDVAGGEGRGLRR